MIDVTHDRHDRRSDRQVALVTLVFTELEVEGLEQLAVLVLWGDDLHGVVELLTEQLERLVVDRLGRGHHLAEAEQHLHERGRVDTDPLREVGEGRPAGEADGLAVALADAYAANGRRFHLLELLATGPLRLTASTRGATRATEGTLGLAATTGAAATAAARTEARASSGTATAWGAGADTATTGGATTTGGTTAAAAGTSPAAGTSATGTARATTTWAGAEGRRGLGHHRRVGTRHAGPAAVARGGGPRCVLVTAGGGRPFRGRRPPAHALAGRERVVARSGRAGASDGPRSGRLGCGRGGCCGRSLRLGRGLGRSVRQRRLGQRLGPRLGLGRGGGRCLRCRGLRCRSGRLGLAGSLGGRSLGLRGLRGGLGGLLLRRGLDGRRRRVCLQLLAVLLAEAVFRGELDSGARRLDELPHLFELLENELALDSELFGEFVDSGLSHASPSGPRPGPPTVRRGCNGAVSGCANSS